MGIRYLAISVDNDDYERVKAGPCPSCGTRPSPRYDYDDPAETTLDLDKSWRYFQRILRGRPSEILVDGEVTHTGYGWISHQGCLSPREVEVAAADLATITVQDIQKYFLGEKANYLTSPNRAQDDCAYVTSYLSAAQTFTRGAAGAGRGIVYYIG